MATPAAPTWSDVIASFLDGLKSMLYEFGQFLVTNASAIAQAILGIGLAVGIGYAVYRAMPFVRRLFRF